MSAVPNGRRRASRVVRDAGVALAELLVASAVGLLVLAAAAVFLWDQMDAAATQPEVADVQQRGRLAAELIARAVASAGAWGDHGGPVNPASCCAPVIEPRRIGSRSADPPGTARHDVITVVRAQAGAPVAVVDGLSGGVLSLRAGAGCPTALVACGLRKDDHLLIADPSGRHDFLVVDAVAGLTAAVSPRQPAMPTGAGADAAVVAVETLTFTFDAGRRQVRLYDGHQSDVPIVDDVVAARFEYFGDAGVPSRSRTDGDSCWFDADGWPKYGRAGAPNGAPLVPIALDEFQDGPWCGQGDNLFDADLLRIRLVRAVIRLQSSAATTRGQSAAFLDVGRAVGGRRWVPDLEITIDSAIRGPAGG